MLVWSPAPGESWSRDQRKVDNDNDNDNDNAAWPGQAPAGSRDQLEHQDQLEHRDQLQRIEDREHVQERRALVALVELERWRLASF